MASLRLGRAIIFPILFRCLLWALVAATVGSHIAARSDQTTFFVVLLIYTAMYTLIWCVWLRALIRVAERRQAVLLIDLLLSFIPAWVTGGWSSPFLLFALGVLALPGLLFRWRGALAALIAYVVADLIVGWTTLPTGSPGLLISPSSLLVYGRLVLIAAIWPLGWMGWEWWQQRQARSVARTGTPEGQPVMEGRRFGGTAAIAALPAERPSGPALAPALSRSRSNSQTIERQPVLALYAAIRQAVIEAEEQGLAVQLRLDGDEPPLPPGHVQLLAKVVEVGLDNIRCHAHTRDAEVIVSECQLLDSKGVSVQVRDHGSGFLDGTADPPGFHQLRRLRYRLLEIEGTFDIREIENSGVVLTACLPDH